MGDSMSVERLVWYFARLLASDCIIWLWGGVVCYVFCWPYLVSKELCLVGRVKLFLFTDFGRGSRSIVPHNERRMRRDICLGIHESESIEFEQPVFSERNLSSG